MKRERKMCLNCPACFKPLKDGLAITAGGYEDRMVGDQMMICCRPGETVSRKRTMDKFDYYCLATERGKKIAKGADYTGLTPKWCPRLKEDGK